MSLLGSFVILTVLTNCPCDWYASSHIRQLLYIALYPPQTDNGTENAEADPISPRKAAKQQKSPLYPSSAAAVAAQQVLMSIAHTNSPSGLFQALPSYASGNATGPVELDDEDSIVGKEAICIKESRNCWAILKEGFIRRKTFAISSPKPKRKGRQDYLEDDPFIADSEIPAVVSPNAWPVLDWIVTIFERDEVEQTLNGHRELHGVRDWLDIL